MIRNGFKLNDLVINAAQTMLHEGAVPRINGTAVNLIIEETST